MEFKDVPKSGTYSLSYINEYGEEDKMVEDVPFDDLQDPHAAWNKGAS